MKVTVVAATLMAFACGSSAVAAVEAAPRPIARSPQVQPTPAVAKRSPVPAPTPAPVRVSVEEFVQNLQKRQRIDGNARTVSYTFFGTTVTNGRATVVPTASTTYLFAKELFPVPTDTRGIESLKSIYSDPVALSSNLDYIGSAFGAFMTNNNLPPTALDTSYVAQFIKTQVQSVFSLQTASPSAFSAAYFQLFTINDPGWTSRYTVQAAVPSFLGGAQPTGNAGTGGSGSSGSGDGSSGGSSGGAVAGGVIGGLLAVAALGALVWFLLRRKRRQAQGSVQLEKDMEHGEHHNNMAMPPAGFSGMASGPGTPTSGMGGPAVRNPFSAGATNTSSYDGHPMSPLGNGYDSPRGGAQSVASYSMPGGTAWRESASTHGMGGNAPSIRGQAASGGAPSTLGTTFEAMPAHQLSGISQPYDDAKSINSDGTAVTPSNAGTNPLFSALYARTGTPKGAAPPSPLLGPTSSPLATKTEVADDAQEQLSEHHEQKSSEDASREA